MLANCLRYVSRRVVGHKLRKYKGRTAFQGNSVRYENDNVALFSELGSSPATMEAGKAVDAYGSPPGHVSQQNDGVQAYTGSHGRCGNLGRVTPWIDGPNHGLANIGAR